jgi:hypothetical protein
MAPAADSLPTDLAAAHAMIIAQRDALMAAEARASAASGLRALGLGQCITCAFSILATGAQERGGCLHSEVSATEIGAVDMVSRTDAASSVPWMPGFLLAASLAWSFEGLAGRAIPAEFCLDHGRGLRLAPLSISLCARSIASRSVANSPVLKHLYRPADAFLL